MSETSQLSRLSLAALRSADALGVRNPPVLFEHLYAYNSVASTENLNRRFSDAAAVREELGLISGGQPSTLLAQHWTEMPEEVTDGWLSWIRPARFERLAGSGSTVQFKLYLSPAIEALPIAFARLVETLSFSRATSFKVGANAADLLRPDKIVAYFQTQADLAESAQRLANCLTGVPPQGVPFTAEIADDGLLSWGVDPPVHGRALGETARSWREWVCSQLAVALVDSQEGGSTTEPAWQRALEQLRRLGIDTERWLPPPSSWRTAPR